MKIRLQIAAVVLGAAGLGIAGLWAAVHFKHPGWLLLCIPAFALAMAG